MTLWFKWRRGVRMISTWKWFLIDLIAPDAELSRRACKWLRNKWTGQVFMAIGMKDPVLGPPAMQALRNDIQSCHEPFEYPEAGHFVQEWGEKIDRKALLTFEDDT